MIYSRLVAILEKCIFLQFRGLKSKIMVPSGLVSGESSLPGLKIVAFLLCVHLVFPLCLCTKTERVLWGVSSSSYKDISLIRIGLTLMTSLNLNYLLKGPISKYSHTGLPHMSFVDIKFSPKHDTINSLSSFFSEGIGLDFQSV